jgi:predicted DNA-binding transcriptional regulator YafY
MGIDKIQHGVQVVGKGDIITFTYKNYRGEVDEREIEVYGFLFGSNDWHKDPQFLMQGWDRKKNVYRVFAMRDVTNLKYIGSARNH